MNDISHKFCHYCVFPTETINAEKIKSDINPRGHKMNTSKLSGCLSLIIWLPVSVYDLFYELVHTMEGCLEAIRLHNESCVERWSRYRSGVWKNWTETFLWDIWVYELRFERQRSEIMEYYMLCFCLFWVILSWQHMKNTFNGVCTDSVVG